MVCKKEEYAQEFCRAMQVAGKTWIEGSKYSDSQTYWRDKIKVIKYYFSKGLYATLDYLWEEMLYIEETDEDGYILLYFEDYDWEEYFKLNNCFEAIIKNAKFDMILSYINSNAELLRLKPITISDWGVNA